MWEDFTVPGIPDVPAGYKFAGFTTVRMGHKRDEISSKDAKSMEVAVERMLLDSLIVYATVYSPDGKPELHSTWKPNGETCTPWAKL